MQGWKSFKLDSRQRQNAKIIYRWWKIVNKTDVLFELEFETDTISRSYAIKQIEMAIAESEDDDERLQFERFKDFLKVLPSSNGVLRQMK